MPVAATVKVADVFGFTVSAAGCVVMVTGVLTERVAVPEMTLPTTLESTTS